MQAAQDSQKAFEGKVEGLVDRLMTRLMPAQKKGLQCAIACFDAHKDHKDVGRCTQGCQTSFDDLGKHVDRELKGLQGSIQGCVQVVQTRIRPKMEELQRSPNPALQSALEAELGQGVCRCFKEAEPTLSEIEERIAGRISSAM